jgi:hypothetical protein
MRLKIIVVAILVVLSNGILAQDFLPGSIVTNNGDTINCLIKSAKWDINPNRIVTKTGDKSKKYWPTEIASFHVNNRTYVSARVRLDVSNHMDGTLDLTDSRPKFANDSIFAEQIFTGNKSLYRYKSPSYKLHFLISVQPGRLEPLIYKRFLVWVDVVAGKTFKQVAYNEEYKNQLELFFADCVEFKDKIKITGYDAGQLTSLFGLYHRCSN